MGLSYSKGGGGEARGGEHRGNVPGGDIVDDIAECGG